MSAKHPCACCTKPIGIGFLMCGAHWKQVPRDVQDEVYRTWRTLQRTAGILNRAAALEAYLDAKEKAIACVKRAQSADGVATGEPT